MLRGLPEEFGWLVGSPSEWCQGSVDRMSLPGLEVEETSQNCTFEAQASVVAGKGQ